MKRFGLKLLFALLFACPFVLVCPSEAQQPINLLNVDGTPLGAPSTYGTAPSGTVMGVNAYITNTPAVNLLDINGTALGAPSTYGTAPSGTVLGANVYVTNTPAVTGSGVFEVGPTTAVNTKTNPFFFDITDGTNDLTAALSAWGTAPTGTYVMGVNADLFINGVIASAAASGVQKVGAVGNAGGIFDAVGQNAASPANELLIGGQFNTTPTTITSGNMSPLQLNASGQLLVACTGCSAASTVSLVPETTGGVTASHLVAAAGNNATVLKASAGQIYGASIYDNAAYPVFLKFYNTASAPTVGTTTVVYEVAVQAGTEREVHSEEGVAFSAGIAYATTKGIADSDTSTLAASDATMDLLYK
jgi:hypothetical protein